MALILPLPTSSFWDAIPLKQGSTFELDEAMTVDRTGNGQVIGSSLGDRLWVGQITFALSSDIERRTAKAALTAVRQPGFPFFCYDRKRQFPYADPDGSILGASEVTVLVAGEDNLGAIEMVGLPSRYEFTAGDLLGYSYGSDPTRYYVHEILQSVTGRSDGWSRELHIAPFRSHALDQGTPVTLIRPKLTAKYDPGSFGPGTGRNGGVEEGRTFRFIQTMEY